MHIMDIYTKLLLVQSDEQVGRKGKGETKLKSYEDIFFYETRDGHPIKRAIINGSAGRGKTTLFDKMAYDWAKGSSEALRKYKLVFVLKMRELEQTSDLMDAIFDKLLDKKTLDRSDLNKFIDTNPDKVLILLDGFDEFQTKTLHESSFGSILKILNQKEGREMCVFVTTRPSHYDKLVRESLVQQPFTHLSVLGFNAEDIEQYVKRFYTNKDDKAKAKSLIQRIQSSHVLCDLAKSPMLLLLMCLLWRDNSQLPDTMTRLYSEALTYIFRRKAKDMSPDEISKIVIAIGKVALDGLMSPDQLLSFKETHFEKTVLDTAVRAGILTRQRVLKGLDIHHSVHFIHKTFQEYCAGMYWQSLLTKTGRDTGKFQEILDQIGRTIGHDPSSCEYLLRFCCGDNEECTSRICQILVKQKSFIFPYIYMYHQMALNCYFESQSENLPSVDFINSVITENIDITRWNSDCLNSFIYFLTNVTHQTMSRGNSYLDKVRTVSIHGSNLQKFIAKLSNNLSGMTNLSVLKLSNCSLTDSNMKDIASSLVNKANLTDLDLTMNEALGGSAILWSPHLKQMKHLQMLDLSCTHVQIKDLKSSVGHMSNLVCCLVGIGGYLVEQTSAGIKLNLSGCSLTGTDLIGIVEAISNRSDLVELILSKNYGLGGSAASWSPHLKKMKHLQKLYLSYCQLIGEDMKHIAVSLSDMPTLVELNLRGNTALGGSAISWSPHLKQMKHLQMLDLSCTHVQRKDLKSSVGHMSNLVCCLVDRYLVEQTSAGIKLDLSGCSLTGTDLLGIVEAISNRSDLVELILSENDGLGGSAISWSPHLKQMKHLQKLHLSWCSLTHEYMKHIAVSLSDMPTLVELNLLGNTALGGSAISWSPHLKKMKRLQKLDLSYCQLIGEDMKYIAVSLSDMPTLVELNLNNNIALGGSAISWSPHLKKMKHLQKLHLSWCSLTHEDMKHIDVSLSDMPTLVELDLDDGNRSLKLTFVEDNINFHTVRRNILIELVGDGLPSMMFISRLVTPMTR